MKTERYYHQLHYPLVNNDHPWNHLDPAYFLRAVTLEDQLVEVEGRKLLVLKKRTDCFWRDRENPAGKFVNNTFWTNVPGSLAGEYRKADELGIYTDVKEIQSPVRQEHLRELLKAQGFGDDIRFGEWRC